MPTSTMALMGRFPSLMGRFPPLMGRFPDFALRGRFISWKSTGKQPIKKRGVKRFWICAADSHGYCHACGFRDIQHSTLLFVAVWVVFALVIFMIPVVFVTATRVQTIGLADHKSGGVRVRFQAVKVPPFGGFPVENPTNKATASKLFLMGISLSEARLRRLSEYGSVACLVERPTRETQAEQYSDTVLIS